MWLIGVGLIGVVGLGMLNRKRSDSSGFVFGWSRLLDRQVVRECDDYGCGDYLAWRDKKTRRHNGVDFVVSGNADKIYAPFKGKVVRRSQPYADDDRFHGIEIQDEEFRYVKIFYCWPMLYAGQEFERGQQIAFAENLNVKYLGITNHVHVEAYTRESVRLNPTYLFG